LADLGRAARLEYLFELNDAALAKEVGLPPDTTKGTDTMTSGSTGGVSLKAVCALASELRDPGDMYLEATTHRGWFQSSL